jgi:hypothetical protein
MNKYFNIKTCPLCQKPLYLKYIDGSESAYRCVETVTATFPTTEPSGVITTTLTHYEVLMRDGMSTVIQTSIFSPYRMETVARSGRTKIFQFPHLTANLIMEIPTLLPDRSPEEMVAKIKVLALFS